MANAVAVDQGLIAWTTIIPPADGLVWVATRDGGTPRCVAPYSYPPLPGGSVAMRGGHVYWSDFSVAAQRGFVMRAPLDGGQAETFSSEPQYPFSLTLDDSHAYWVPLGLDEIHRKPLIAGPTEVFATAQNGLGAIALDGPWVYWAGQQSQQIRRASASGGGAVTTLVTLNRSIAQVRVKSGFVYWLPGGDAAVYRQALSGGTTQVVASNPETVLNFETDGAQIYWFRSGASIGTGPMLFGAPVGGPASLLLTVRSFGSIVVDGADVYFGGDTLRRLPR